MKKAQVLITISIILILSALFYDFFIDHSQLDFPHLISIVATIILIGSLLANKKKRD